MLQQNYIIINFILQRVTTYRSRQRYKYCAYSQSKYYMVHFKLFPTSFYTSSTMEEPVQVYNKLSSLSALLWMPIRGQLCRFCTRGRRGRPLLDRCQLNTWRNLYTTWPVYILIQVLTSVVLRHPVTYISFLIVRYVTEPQYFMRRRCLVKFTLLRHLPLPPHHPLEVLQERCRGWGQARWWRRGWWQIFVWVYQVL